MSDELLQKIVELRNSDETNLQRLEDVEKQLQLVTVSILDWIKFNSKVIPPVIDTPFKKSPK